MLIGKATIEHFEECLKKGFCKEHKKQLVGFDFKNHEVQRKAILFLRLQVFSPLLFHKPFTFEKMRVLFQDYSFYGKSENPESDPEFLGNILYLDAIIVYTICHFSKICCPGILFKQNTDLSAHCTDKHLLDILQKKDIDINEISYLVPLFKENFEGKREHLYKLGYVATMLLVRNVSSRIELKSALEKLDKELNNIPSECGKWLDIGQSQMNKIKRSSEPSTKQYEEAIEAYTCGLKYSSYALNLLRERADMYFQVRKLKESALDSYRVLMIQPISKKVEPLGQLARALYCLSVALHGLGLFDETLSLLEYALRADYLNHEMRTTLVTMQTMTEFMRNRTAHYKLNGTVSMGQIETEKTTSNENGSKAVEEKKDIPELIEASDSDLSESDEEDIPDLMDASNSEDSSSESDDSVVDLDDDNAVVKKIDDVPKTSGVTSQQSQKTWPPLSNGAIHRIRNGEDVQQPVFQILAYRKSFTSDDFFRLIISDGVTEDSFALLGSELNHLMIRKKLEKFTIVRVEKYRVEKGVEGSRGLITLLNVTILAPGNEVNEKLGNPTIDIGNATALNNNSADANTDHSVDIIPAVLSDSPPIANIDNETKNMKIKRLLTEASQNLLSGKPSALQLYREALDEIKAFPKEHEYSEDNIVCIKYALGSAYYKSGGYDELLKAISTFKEIVEDGGSDIFRAAYYGIALSNRKLNRFKEALHYLQILDDVLQGSSSYKDYTWPESSTIIEETVTENLKTLVADLMNECENPPSPEATCRFSNCSLQTAIYNSDPDFKGFFVIQCSSHCTLQYHPSCWKLLKTEKHFSDKEFLDKNCLTPDCDGCIVKIQNVGKDGDIKRAFESAEFKKSSKKKTRLEKKLEVKEEKRRKRKDSSSKSEATSENANEPDQLEATKDNVHPLEGYSTKGDAKTEIKDRSDGPSSSKATPVYPDTFTIIKKGKIPDENVNKASSKVKANKNAKITMSIDEFLDNHDTTYSSASDYQQRINSLQQIKENAVNKQTPNIVLKPTAPVFEPKDMRTISFAQNQASLGLDDFPQMPNSVPATDTSYDMDAIATAENTSPAFNPTKLLPNEFSVECAKKNIYAYLKNILYKHGPLREDDPILVRELQGFPVEANALIADCGGLGKFLQLSVDFAFVGDEYVCTVDQIAKAYDKKNSADIPLISKDFSPIDGYPSYSSREDFRRGYNDSFLNPDAQEYSPGAMAKNPPHLISAISKLRQPLTVADDSVVKPTDDSFCKGSEVPLDGLNCSSSVKGEAPKFPTKLQLAHKCADAVKGYFSEDASEYRSFIRQFIQPYAIVEVSKKSSVLVQTDNDENENLLRNARKTDEELQRLREVVNCLTEQNVSLKEQNELLGEQCTLALDNVTKLQNKSSVELLSLKKELEDTNLALEEQAKASKSKESKLEKEIKGLNEVLKKNKDEESAQKAEMSKLQANLKSSLTQAEDRINLLLNEKHILKTTLDLQINKLRETVQDLETDKAKALKRAEDAELKLLEVQRISYLKIVDGKAADAVKRMKELEDGIAIHKKNLNPVYATNFFALLKQIQAYISKLAAIRTEFTNKIDEQVNSIKSGMPLEALKQLEMAELPEIPSWTSLQSMQNGQAIPSAQAQFLNLNPMQMMQSALGQMPASNGYFNAPFNAPPQMPIGTPRQPIYPTQNNTNQGAIPKTTTVPQNKKLPPGLANVQAEPAKAPETVPQAMPQQQQASNVPQAMPKQQQASNVPQAMPKQQQASNVPQTTPKKQQPVVPQTMVKEETGVQPKASGSGTKSLGGSALSPASGVSKLSTDLKKSSDSLELDYNVKKTKAKAVKPTEPASSAASTTSKSNKKSYEKLMARLRVAYPEATQAQITAMVKDFRSEKSSLSGLTIDMIISEIIAMVEAKKKEENRKAAALAMKMQKIPNKPLVNKKLGASEDAAKEAEMNAKKGACAWGVGGDSSKQWHGKEVDEPCTICFEEMTPRTAYKVDCGHTFHRTCIQEWINKKSDCPICRVHLLLPEDYPAL